MASVFEVRDEVWEVVEPLLPAVEAKATGRPRVADRWPSTRSSSCSLRGSPGVMCPASSAARV